MEQQDRFLSQELQEYIQGFKKAADSIFSKNPRDKLTPSQLMHLIEVGNSAAVCLFGKEPDRIFEKRNKRMADYLLSRALYILEEEGEVMFKKTSYQFAVDLSDT